MTTQPFQFACEAWLIVARGGWWTAPEIMKHLPLSMRLDSAVKLQAAHNRLYVMAQRDKSLTVRDRKPHSEYAVTPGCKLPRGLTVDKVMAALNGKD